MSRNIVPVTGATLCRSETGYGRFLDWTIICSMLCSYDANGSNYQDNQGDDV
ncbi:MAG TPA: hypothetical protein VG604_00580 [Candidatus Saccharimonadales bacterium]|nr:hypothetical protein [Candidatus Saccharimonadales bacterium]